MQWTAGGFWWRTAARAARECARSKVLVDCDNTTPEILEYALRVVAQFGRVVLRRGYGTHATLANKWQEALVRMAFTPCLQYQYAAGKNTADIALAWTQWRPCSMRVPTPSVW